MVEAEIPKPRPWEMACSETSPALLSSRSRDGWSEDCSFVRICLPRENHDDVGILDIAGVVAVSEAFRDSPTDLFPVGSPASGRTVERAV